MYGAAPPLSIPSSVGAKQDGPKLFSCTTCKQRKVKCNRSDPCCNCVKAGAVCTFVSPAPSRRRKRKPAKEGLHARLSRYERILQSYGAKIDATNMQDGSEESSGEDQMEITPKDDVSDAVNPESRAKDKLKEAKLVSQRGKSRYIDNDLWSTLTEEINDPDDLFSDGSDEESAEPALGTTNPLDENALLLGMSHSQILNALHPRKDVLLRLWETFHENINPLIKIIHVPSFRKTIDAFCVSPYQVSKSIEALLFAIYLAAVSSLDEDECVQIVGAPKKTVISKYRTAAQQALVNATFLKSTSIVTLQAYYIFLMSTRLWYDSGTLLCLTAVGIRIARRLGLHRDGVLLGLPPFEVEMRRRLWWQLAFLDGRTADLCGSRPSLDLQCDTRQPLNVNDSDLSPDMTEAPKERSEVTEMIFCMVKSQVGDFLRITGPPISFDGLSRSSMTLLDKDELINKLQDILEQKFLRHCDPLQPLHHLCSILCRIAICKLRLSVHKSLQHAGQGESMPQSESDLIFDNGMRVIAYGNLLHSAPTLKSFRWFIGANFLWDSFIYFLIELRRRKTGHKVDHAWSQITQLFENYPQVLTESSNPLYAAVGIWSVKVWEECSTAREGTAPLKTPDFITQFRRNRLKVNNNSPEYLSSVPTDPVMVGGTLLSYDRVDYLNQPSDIALNIPYGDWAQLDPMI